MGRRHSKIMSSLEVDSQEVLLFSPHPYSAWSVIVREAGAPRAVVPRSEALP